jgi:putative ABC transport system permease protein
MIRSYFQTALRIIKRHVLYSSISIAGLALGMACCFVILVFLSAELSYDDFHREADSIFRVVRKMPDIHGPSTRNPMAPAMKEEFPEIELAVRTWPLPDPYTFRVGEKAFRQKGILFADPGFFRLFTHEVLFGDPIHPLENPSSIVLTRSASRKYFGRKDPVGETLSFDGKFDLIVSAVIQDVPRNSHLQFEAVIPMEKFNAIGGHIYGYDASAYRLTDQWMWGMLHTYLKLRKGSDPRSMEQKFPGFLEKYAPRNKELLDETLYLQPVKDIHLHSRYRSGSDKISDLKFIYGIMAIGLVILAMSCFNYINLTTARFSARRKEIGIRKVMGAQRRQLIEQILAESLVFFLAAYLLSFVLALLLAPVVNSIMGYSISAEDFARYDLPLFLSLIGLLAALLSGAYPALFFASFRPLGMIKKQAFSRGRGRVIRSGFVIFQFSITIGLLIASGLVYQQVRYLKNKDLGYVKEQIVIVPVKDERVRERHETIKQELARLPRITGVSFSAALPSQIRRSTTMDLEIEGNRKVFEMNNARIDEDFLSLYEIEIHQGRNFSREFPSDPETSIILNEKAVKTLNWQDPVGRELTIFGGPRRVIGVVEDFNFQTLHSEIGPLALRAGGEPHVFASVRLSTENIPQTLAGIEKTFLKISPQTPFEYYFLDEYFNNLYRSEESFGRTIGYFTMLAIVISCLGLFGLAYFITEQRTKEIGIRKVLGASVPGIVGMLSWGFAKWAILANGAAWPVAYLVMYQWLQNFAYRIAIGLGTFLLAGALALLIGLLTVSLQTVRAAAAPPADTLRYE